MNTIQISSLTPEQRAQLKAELEAEDRAEKAKQIQQRNDYESLKEAQVKETFKMLQDVSNALEIAKNDVFNQFGSILKMKQELFGLSEEEMAAQQSHTFTTSDGSISIIVGANTIDRWNDNVSVGIARINAWLDKLITDNNSAQMVGIIRDLLKPNREGILKASRVLDLSKKAAEIGDQELIGAVDLIRDCYQPTKTSKYVKAKYVDGDGITTWIPLSMSAV
jgi:hypothetical protein